MKVKENDTTDYKQIMKLKGNYSIDESGRYTVIFEDENGEEWEVEFSIWIGKEYVYEETGKFLKDVNVTAKCLSPGLEVEEEVSMEMALEEHIKNNFNL